MDKQIRTNTVQTPEGPREIEITIDYALIARRLARKALRNKTGRARHLHGAVVVKRVNI